MHIDKWIVVWEMNYVYIVMSDYALPVAAWCNHFFVVSRFQKEFVLYCCNTAKQVAFCIAAKSKQGKVALLKKRQICRNLKEIK